MAKLFPVYTLILLGLSLSCSATTYTVGDSSGWDISTDLGTWPIGKTFVVGDVLLFQYSSSESVDEVTKGSFDACNTTVTLKSYSGGNTTIPLTKAGEWYFVSGNKLYCLGGMKLQVNVEQNPAANSPAETPQAATGSGVSGSIPSTSKSNNPATTIPTSDGFVNFGRHSFMLASLGLLVTVMAVFKI